MDRIKALLFDVFGTLVDWRTAVAREVEATAARHGTRVDAFAFADAWRAQYQPSMEAIRAGREPFCPLDTLHRRNLDAILPRFGLDGLPATERAALNLAWHRLDAWPDVTGGLARLRRRFRLAPCSNGNVSLMVDLARRNGFAWDAILGAEFARDYKPKPAVYLASAAAFDCAPAEAMMVAAHTSDLVSAAAAGLRTAFVARPDEFGAGGGEARPGASVDVVVTSLDELADRLRPA
jgi:2-haloacid dehalogenase